MTFIVSPDAHTSSCAVRAPPVSVTVVADSPTGSVAAMVAQVGAIGASAWPDAVWLSPPTKISLSEGSPSSLDTASS